MKIKKIPYYFRYIKKRIWSTNSILLLMRPAGVLPDEALRKPCPGEFRPVTEDNIRDCAAFEDASHYVPIYRDMLEHGDFVLFGYLDGDCVFRCCLKRSGRILFEGCVVRDLSPEESYIHYSFCALSARGHGFHPESIHRFCSSYPDITIYTMVLEDNIASLRGFVRNNVKIYSRISVKNRFFHRSFQETPLSPAEVTAILNS